METPFPIINKYNYVDLTAETTKEGRKYLLPDGSKLPSVTTILQILPKEYLKAWRDRVGDEEADRITDEACRIGTNMHDRLEGYVSNYLKGHPNTPPANEEEKLALVMAKRIISYGLCNLNEVYGIETALYYNGLYAGRTDLIGTYNGIPSILDYKSTRRPKKLDWIYPYKLQLAAYNLAHYDMFGEKMDQGVILMAVRPPTTVPTQIFILDKSDMNRYEDEWIGILEQFYAN